MNRYKWCVAVYCCLLASMLWACDDDSDDRPETTATDTNPAGSAGGSDTAMSTTGTDTAILTTASDTTPLGTATDTEVSDSGGTGMTDTGHGTVGNGTDTVTSDGQSSDVDSSTPDAGGDGGSADGGTSEADEIVMTVVVPQDFASTPVLFGTMFYASTSTAGMPDGFGDVLLNPEIVAGESFEFTTTQAGLEGEYILAVTLYCEGGGNGQFPVAGVDWIGAASVPLSLGPGTGRVDAGEIPLFLAE